MIYINELRNMILYRRPFFLPINEKNKKKGSVIYLLTPNYQSSINTMQLPYMINKRSFESYYTELSAAYIINHENSLIREGDLINEVVEGYKPSYISNDIETTNEYIRIKESNLMVFNNELTDEDIFNESSSKYNAPLKKLLYNERLRNRTEVFEIYDKVKEALPWIKKTYIDYKFYKGFNLFVDWSHYSELFFKNNMYKLDRGVDLYFEFINRFLEDKRLPKHGYDTKTVFIPVHEWNNTDLESFFDYKKNINPISVINRLFRTNLDLLKKEWGKYTFVFLGKNGYFKVNFNEIEKGNLAKFNSNIKRLLSNEPIMDPVEDINKESPKAITTNIIDKIEQSQNIKIYNLAGETDKKTAKEIEKHIADLEKNEKDVKELSTDEKKAVLVKRIEDKAKEADNTEEALDAIDDDEFIKQILIDLAAEEDDAVKVSASRTARINNLTTEFEEKEFKGKTVKQLLENKEKSEPLPVTELPIDTINDEWKNMTYMNFENAYDIDEDIVAILHSFSKMTVPVGIRSINAEDMSTSEDLIATYTVECEDINGKRFTLKFDIPLFKNNRFMRLRGNDKTINGQLMLLPIIKTDEDTVQIVSNYKKIFIRRNTANTGKSYVVADRIIKALGKYEGNKIKVTTGDNRIICSKYELPVDYIDLAGSYNTIEVKGEQNVIFYFNQDKIREMYTIDKSKGIPYAVVNGKEVLYYNDNTFAFSTHLLSYLNKVDSFADLYDATNVSTKYAYSKASILNTEIPVIVVMGYNVGLIKALNAANITYELSEKRPQYDKSFEDIIRFSDGFLKYKLDYNSSLLMNGLKECDTAAYSLTEVNKKTMWVDFLDNFGGRIKADGLDNFYDLMVDPITAEVCEKYKLPTKYIDQLAYANLLLSDNKYNKHVDISGNRFRTNELVAGYLYRELATSYGEYRTQLKRNKTGAVMSIKQTAVIDALLADPTTSDLSILNPLLEAESANAVSFKGLSGMNSDHSYTLDKRTYDKSMVNVLALSTGFAANVGITRQATIDMNVETKRGYIKTTEDPDNMSVTKTLCMTEALTPMGSTRDDPFRSAMTFIQTSKHGMRVKKSMPSLISNGADEALPYMTSDTFAFKAKDNGEITDKTDDYMIVTYKDGTSEYINLKEEVKKNSDGGFFVTIKLDTDLKKGSKVKKGDIVAYDKLSYSDVVGLNDNIAYNAGTLCKVAIMNTDEGFEDSAIVSEWLSDAMTTNVIVCKEVTLPKTTNVYNMVKKGQAISEGDPLLIFQNSFDEDEYNVLLKNLTDDEDSISELGRIPIRSKVTGIVRDIKIYRTVETSELSSSLKKIVNEYEKDIKTTKKVMEKNNITSELKTLPADYKLDPTGKLKNARDSILIEFYLEYEDKFSVGDKLVYYSANKGVCKDIFPKGKEPYSTFRPDEKIDTMVAIGGINARMVTSIQNVAAINKVVIELSRKVKDIMGIDYKYINED